MKAIALLSFWKSRNALRTLFTDPRKLVPFLIVVLSIGFSLSMSAFGLSQSSRHAHVGALNADPTVYEGIAFIVLVLVAIGTIDTGLGDGLLAFAMPDVDYLFPAPISRRTVLAYRLPGLTMGALFSTLFLIYIWRLMGRVLDVQLPSMGHSTPPWWLGPAGIALCVGIYLNLAMYLAIRFENRRQLHRLLMTFFVGGSLGLGLFVFLKGSVGFVSVVDSPVLRWLFLPSHLAAEGIYNDALHVTNFSPLYWLLGGYAASLVPMFATNSNYYEQSIASTEKMATLRKAAKGGYASLQASKAASVKYKSTRTYTLPPFGTGSGALAWAHLCAAFKRPFVNFVIPLAAGLICGVLGSLANMGLRGSGIGLEVFFTVYSSIGFMASAKAASESAVRRRELIAPLPIKGWEAVLANLVVPWSAMFEFCLVAGTGYALMRGDYWPEMLFGIALFFPLRLASRMALQYILVLCYPDFADKVQQFLAAGVYYLAAAPFFIGEMILVIPAILLKSVWLGLALLTVLQIPYLFVTLLLAGIATERAVATGEPVSLINLVTRRKPDLIR